MQKIAENVTGYPEADKDGTIFYEKTAEMVFYTSWINDPYKDSDQNEPDYDENEADWYEWNARVEARKEAIRVTQENMTSLFSYSKGKESRIADHYYGLDNSGSSGYGSAFVCYIYNPEHIEKVHIDDLMYSDMSVDDYFSNAVQGAMETCLYTDGRIIPLEKSIRQTEFDSSGKAGCGIYFEDNDGGGVVYSFDCTKNSDGRLKKVGDNALNILFIDGEDVYYERYSDSGNNDENSLCCNGREINHYTSNIVGKVDEYIIYTTVKDEIRAYNGKDSILISDNALMLDPNYKTDGEGGEEYMLILDNIESENAAGVLSLYNDLKLVETVDNDVEKVLGY